MTTGCHSALPELFENPFPFPSLCSDAGAGILLVSNTSNITASEDGFYQ